MFDRYIWCVLIILSEDDSDYLIFPDERWPTKKSSVIWKMKMIINRHLICKMKDNLTSHHCWRDQGEREEAQTETIWPTSIHLNVTQKKMPKDKKQQPEMHILHTRSNLLLIHEFVLFLVLFGLMWPYKPLKWAKSQEKETAYPCAIR